MGKIIIISLIFLSSQAFADNDRLDELSKVLRDGSYAHPDDIDLPKVSNKNVNISEKNIEQINISFSNEDQKKLIKVLPEDYIKIGIKPAYKDSDIEYLPKEDVYYETKNFSNGIKMLRVIGEDDVAFFNLADSEDFAKMAWSVSCYKDHITDEKFCNLSKYEVVYLRGSKSGLLLTVSKELKKLNTTRTHYFRVDKNQPLKTKNVFKGNNILIAINQMKNGQTLYTRFTEWDGEQYEERLSLDGFSVALEYMNLMYSKLK